MLDKTYTFTYKDTTERKKKNFDILETIRIKKETSRTDISKITGINIVSVSNYIDNYIKNGIVNEKGLDVSSGGRRPELISLNTDENFVIGIEIGPQRIKAIITDINLSVKAREQSVRFVGSMDDVSQQMVDVLCELIRKTSIPLAKVKLIGIGVSGVFDLKTGIIHDTDPTRGKTKTNIFSIARKIEENFKIKTLVGNDATCAVVGEKSLMGSEDIKYMLYVYSDVGCGIIINGDIYCGTGGSAGEIQLSIDKSKEHPKEVYAYGIRNVDLGISNKAKELAQKGQAQRIKEIAQDNIDSITKETVFFAANEDDSVAKEILIEAANWLGIKVAYLVNIFNPQIIVIGGGMEKAGPLFFETLEKQIKEYTYEEAFSDVRILPSFLGEDAVALGAAFLSVREIFLNS